MMMDLEFLYMPGETAPETMQEDNVINIAEEEYQGMADLIAGIIVRRVMNRLAKEVNN